MKKGGIFFFEVDENNEDTIMNTNAALIPFIFKYPLQTYICRDGFHPVSAHGQDGNGM